MTKLIKNGYTYVVIGTLILAYANYVLLNYPKVTYLKDAGEGFGLTGLAWIFLTTGILILIKNRKK
jgi:hypothetical protein